MGGCWTPGPGQRDPTRYPWDQPQPDYCIMSLETGSATGIASGDTVQLACVPPPAKRSR